MSAHHYRCPMRWGDMDAQGHVNNAVYLDYFQDARVHFLLTGPPVLGQMLESGVLVVNHQVEYLAPVTFSDRPLDLHLGIAQLGGSRFTIAYEVHDGDVLVARARTGAVPYDLATSSLRRLKPEERDLLAEKKIAVEPLREVARVEVGADDHQSPLTVRWSDLDAYGHVNNVKFYDYIQEARIALVSDRLDWADSGPWLVVRQDVDYRRPVDFRLEPYEVVTAVAAVGSRSVTLSAEVRDPGGEQSFASARTVLVGPHPLTEDQRRQLMGPSAPSPRS